MTSLSICNLCRRATQPSGYVNQVNGASADTNSISGIASLGRALPLSGSCGIRGAGAGPLPALGKAEGRQTPCIGNTRITHKLQNVGRSLRIECSLAGCLGFFVDCLFALIRKTLQIHGARGAVPLAPAFKYPAYGPSVRSGRPRTAQKPFKKVGGFAPYLFKGLLGHPGPPRPPKRPIFHQITDPPLLNPPLAAAETTHRANFHSRQPRL